MTSSTAAQFLPVRPHINYAGEERNLAIWDAHRETLKRLFLTENCTLEVVKRRMETEHGFPTSTLTEYETILRDRYNFRKNLKASDWHSIGYHVEKRRLQGKSSHVYLGSVLQKPKKVEKEIRRYNRRSALQVRIRNNCMLPPLRQNISIRTPPPEPQRNSNAMIKPFSTAEIAVRAERIDMLRIQSPFSVFFSILGEQMMLSVTTTTRTTEIAQRLATSGTEISPSLTEGPSLAWLSQACFILSNDLDIRLTFTRPLIKWIGISADIHALKSFFSIESPTIRAVWDRLYEESINLKQLQAYTILFELSWLINKGQWVTQRSSCLVEAIIMKATDKVEELLKQPGVNASILIPYQRWYLRHPAYWLYNHVDHMDPLIHPLGVAAFMRDLVMINILLRHGVSADPPPSQAVVPPLFAVLKGDQRLPKVPWNVVMDCIRALLDAGSNVDVQLCYEGCWGWSEPSSPSWLIDYVWTHFPTMDRLLTTFSEKSLKMQAEVTVAGVCMAANQGYAHLGQYLASRQLPNGGDRTAVLQIAISEAAARGLSEPVSCLLQFGVDPNVKYIEDNIEDKMEELWTGRKTWHPAVRAAYGRHHHILGLFGDEKAYPQPLSFIEKLFHEEFTSISESFDSITAALLLVNSLSPKTETHGRSLIFLFLKRANKKNFQVCAKVCDMAWSWGVPMVIEADGRDALHYAIFHDCCLEMVEFLVARGYCVHSKLAYAYDRRFLSSSSSAAETKGPDFSSHSSMLSDAFSSYSEDKLAIVDFLLGRGASTENVRENYTPFEAISTGPRPWKLTSIECREYNDATVEIFKRFFNTDAPVNEHSQRILPVSVLTSLIAADADDSLIFQVIDVTRDINGLDIRIPPLHTALTGGRLAVAKRLLDRGADANRLICAGLMSPLTLACAIADIPIEFIEDLIKLGADINLPIPYPPLLMAVDAGRLNIVALLLKYGANINIRCKPFYRGIFTPLDIAAKRGKLDIIHLLRGLGGKSAVPGRTGVDGAIDQARLGGHYAVADFLRGST
ncbi:hypothetical protein F4859DRAFT_529609 [Xylaria cf. heliscus]|nr:hypothetical protein F4859DRAFT_529609 [Xylaria cf. heliscus]